MTALVLGVGFNDKKYPAAIKRKCTKQYYLWQNMLKRCYDGNYQAKQPTYIGCSASDKFKNYSYFYEWCQAQIGFGNNGWQIDKDIIRRDNKVYSEDVCVFVPREINNFFTTRGADRGHHPIGVDFHKITGKYQARCNVNGKSKYLGLFADQQEAFEVYKQCKEESCKQIANKWRSQIDERTYAAMMSWEV
jgi:hypothetical protein